MQQKQVNILIVDDRPENRLAMSSILQSDEYAVLEADCGEEALRKVLQDDFALILMDVQMPGMNGFETVELIKSRERSKHIPVIFVTALSHVQEHIERGYEVGGIDFIYKPFNPNVLKLKVEQFVSMHKDREELKLRKELISVRTRELEAAQARQVAMTEELRRAEAMARAIGDTSIDTFFTVSDEGIIIAANPISEHMFGYARHTMLGKPLRELLQGIDGVLTGGQPMSGDEMAIQGLCMEAAGLRQDGTTFPAEIQVGSVQLYEQPIYICAVRDITERKLHYSILEQEVVKRTQELTRMNQHLQLEVRERRRVSEQLEASYNLINSILESITDSFYALDNDWRITYLNQSAEQQINVTRAQALGRSLWDFVPIERSRSYEYFVRAKQTNQPVHEEFYSVIAKCWLEIRAFPSEQGLSVYVQDTTERRHMIQEAKDSHERFYKIFQASPSLMAICSLYDEACLDVNESWQKHTGYTYAEMLAGLGSLHMMMEASDTGDLLPLEPVYGLTDVKVQFRAKSGELRTGLLSTEMIETPEEPCLLVVITDITDRTMLEHELARLERLHMIGEMAAGIAHEIRNPMTTVRGFLQLMRSNQSMLSTEVIDIMVEELNRANGIISEFLALAKNKTTDRQRNCLNEVIRAIVPLLEAEATLAGKQLDVRLGKCAKLDLDAKEIRQMVLNLALNGLEAMEAGGRLTLATYLEGSEVVLQVADQGPGIEPDVLQKLGTPFFTTKDKGTGLGLAVCFSIAERHQAKLSWQTGNGGTTFLVRFAVPE
ncbi:PAS domain S-box protein [Paenibacillus sp. YYML68]|uniref:PAS domain S-box protein n=1 Tax=Paenibacillus sp. YYML68 TaxID=2909250 RepID=UPI0024927AB2|nr:PAS domain S-box protein [Paenibacillus sp. YYML68]